MPDFINVSFNILPKLMFTLFTHVQKAVETVKKATTEDHKGNYKEAYTYYQHALEYFMTALKCKKNTKQTKRLIKTDLNRRKECTTKRSYSKAIY